MATEVISTIRSSGGDYTSLSSWEAGEQRNLVSANEIEVAECYNDWPSGLNNTVVVSGWTTDSTHYVVIRPASGNGHNGTPGTGFFVSQSGARLSMSQAYTVVTGIEVRNTGANDGLQLNATGAKCFNVLAKAANSAKAAIALDNGTAICCYAFDSGYGYYIGNNCFVYNSIATNCTTRGFWSGAATGVATNCVAYACATNWVGTWGASSTNNATSSASDDAPGSSSVTGVSSSDFANAAGNDFHLSSGSVLRGAGTNLYSTFTTDIDGDTWPSSGAWDIGFDYYVASSSLPTLTNITLSNITTSGYRATVAGS